MFDPLDHETPQEDLDALYRIAFHRHRSMFERDSVALEVGSWAGSSALVLAKEFGTVFCVDTWKGTPSDRLGEIADRLGHRFLLARFCLNMGDRLHRSVFPCVGSSIFWAANWKRPLDLVFIDADHDYESCVNDIQGWMKHVRPGGVICGHDYGVGFPGVTKAVDELVPARKLAGNSIWYWETPSR